MDIIPFIKTRKTQSNNWKKEKKQQKIPYSKGRKTKQTIEENLTVHGLKIEIQTITNPQTEKSWQCNFCTAKRNYSVKIYPQNRDGRENLRHLRIQ